MPSDRDVEPAHGSVAATRDLDMAGAPDGPAIADTEGEDRSRDLLRRLVIADPPTIDRVVASGTPSGLDRRTELLVRLAAVATVSGERGPAVEAAVEACVAAGASERTAVAVIARVHPPTAGGDPEPATGEVQDRYRRPADGDRSTGLDVRLRALVDVVRLISPRPSSIPAEAAPSVGDLRSELTAAGVENREVIGTLLAIGPVVGAARLVGAAHTVARLVGYDVDGDLERPPP